MRELRFIQLYFAAVCSRGGDVCGLVAMGVGGGRDPLGLNYAAGIGLCRALDGTTKSEREERVR